MRRAGTDTRCRLGPVDFRSLFPGMNRCLWLGCLLMLAGGWGGVIGLDIASRTALVLAAVAPMITGLREKYRARP